jgi:gamma-polyglutamate biosynthesis protein CapA
MINKILLIISIVAVIYVWAVFNFYWPRAVVVDNQMSISEVKPEIKNTKVSKNANQNLPENSVKKIDSLKMLFFGDIMLDRHVAEKIKSLGLNWFFNELDKQKVFAINGLVSANLEGAVTNNGAHYPPIYSNDFAFAPNSVKSLQKYNFNFFNIANNHLADQGERGIIETRQNLKDSGFNFSGCPDGQIGNCSYKVFKVSAKGGEYKVGMVGFSMVYSQLNIGKAMKIVSDLTSTTDVVIINIHWGKEYQHNFSQAQQAMAYKLIDAGADIIIGHHPHVVQGCEIYKNKPIFYSLGNFIFDQYFSADTQEELGIRINWQADKMDIGLLPMKSVSSQPRLMTDSEKIIFFNKFVGWSKIDDVIKKEIITGNINL